MELIYITSKTHKNIEEEKTESEKSLFHCLFDCPIK